jgi:hypothetical protein
MGFLGGFLLRQESLAENGRICDCLPAEPKRPKPRKGCKAALPAPIIRKFRVARYIVGREETPQHGSKKLPGTVTMATTTHPHHFDGDHHFDDKHHFDREALARLHATIVFGLIGAGLALCAFGAIAFDIVRLFGNW